MISSRLDDNYGVDVRAAVVPLIVAKVAANSAVRFAPPFLATIASGLHVSLPTLGGALAVGELIGLSAPLVARVAGRLSRRTAICCGLLGIGAGATVCATSTAWPQLAAGLALMSLSKIVFDLGIIAWLTDRVQYAHLGRVVGLTETAWAGGLFVGVVAMGVLTGLTSWRWGYALAAVAIVVMAAMLRRQLPDEPPPAVHNPQAPRPHAALGAGWLVIIGIFGLTAAAQSLFVTFGTWLKDDFDFSETKLAAVIFALGAIELIGTGATVRYVDRLGKLRSAMIGVLVMIPTGLALIALNHHLVVGLALIAVFIGAFEFTIVTTLSLASSLVPQQPSVGLGFMVGGSTLGRALMSPLATAAYARHGMWLPALISTSCATGTLLCHWRYRAVRHIA